MPLQGLYLIISASDLERHGWEVFIEEMARAGVRIIQLREKSLNDRDLLALAQRLVALLEPYHIPLIINDRVDIAYASGAQGVHLGDEDLPPDVARKILGSEAIIGLTIHSLDELQEANEAVVDYFGVGPLYPSPTKSELTPWGLEGLKGVVERSSRPVFAIGGIEAEQVDTLISAGAAGVCVVSAICQAANPFIAAQELAERCSI